MDGWKAGQISSGPQTTSFTPKKVAFWKDNGTPKISEKSRWVKYYNWVVATQIFFMFTLTRGNDPF